MHHRQFLYLTTPGDFGQVPSKDYYYVILFIFLFIYFVEDGLPHQNVYQYRITFMLMLQILQKHFLMRTQMNIVT